MIRKRFLRSRITCQSGKSVRGWEVKILCVSLLLSVALSVQAHPGGKDVEGCHAGKLPHHCHDKQPGRDSPATETGRSSARSSGSEAEYNRWFCAAVDGDTETRHPYTYAGGRSFVKGQTAKQQDCVRGGDWTSAAAWTACSRRCFSVH